MIWLGLLTIASIANSASIWFLSRSIRNTNRTLIYYISARRNRWDGPS